MEQFLTELESRLETNDDQWWFDVDHGTDMLTSAYDVYVSIIIYEKYIILFIACIIL